MRKFLVSIVLLAMILIMPVVVWYMVSKSDYYPLPQGCTTVYLGDSHIECAIDDSILSNSVNLSSAGAPTLCSYIKLRAVLSGENSVETVVLGLWASTLVSSSDRITLSPHFDKRLMYLTYNDFLETKADFKELIRPIILSLLEWKGGSLGGYSGTRRGKLDIDIALKDAEIAQGNGMKSVISKKGLQYEWLLKIRELCEANDIKLILLSPPTYRADHYYNHKQFKQLLRDSLDGFTYVDHSDFEMSDDCYGDIGHLCRTGGVRYSTYIEEHGLLNFGEVIELGIDKN